MTAIRSKAIRKSAQGEACTLAIAGVCGNRTETTVLAHLPDESHGLSRKSDDLSAIFCCDACHSALDRRTRSDELEAHREFYMRRAMVRTWRRLIELGIVSIKP